MNDKELLNHAFNTSPDTVYGVLVGLLVCLVIFLIVQLVKMNKELVQLNRETIASLAIAVQAVERVHENVVEIKDWFLKNNLKK